MGLILIGLVMVFAGSQFLSAVFSILCALALGFLISAALLIILDKPWDSEGGVAISSISFIIAAPFVQFALKFADLYAVPTLGGLCGVWIAEVGCNIAQIPNNNFPYKTVIQLIAFIIVFLIA
jgi:hypothetical protein